MLHFTCISHVAVECHMYGRYHPHEVRRTCRIINIKLAVEGVFLGVPPKKINTEK